MAENPESLHFCTYTLLEWETLKYFCDQFIPIIEKFCNNNNIEDNESFILFFLVFYNSIFVWKGNKHKRISDLKRFKKDKFIEIIVNWIDKINDTIKQNYLNENPSSIDYSDKNLENINFEDLANMLWKELQEILLWIKSSEFETKLYKLIDDFKNDIYELIETYYPKSIWNNKIIWEFLIRILMLLEHKIGKKLWLEKNKFIKK